MKFLNNSDKHLMSVLPDIIFEKLDKKATDFRVAYYGAMLEASMRLKGGYILPLWEDLNFARLKKEMKKI